MKLTWARTACSHPALSGVSRAHFGDLLEELAPKWTAVRESALHEQRGGARRRAAGAGRKQKPVFPDRLLATLVHLRLGLPHAALAELFDVDRSTISTAICEVRPLLAARGFAVPDRPRLRLGTLEDVFAYSEAEGVDLRIDGTEVQFRRPRAGRAGRKAFVSGKQKQNTIKTTTFSDHQGRTLCSGVTRPGRVHDQTAVRTEGIAEQFRLRPKVKAEVDEGYRGLANEFPYQVSAPPRKPKDDVCDGERRAWREQRRRQSSARICVEHTTAEYKQWRPLQRYTGRREDYDETHRAIAALVSDRSARRTTRRRTSTETGARPHDGPLTAGQPNPRPARPDLNCPQGRYRRDVRLLLTSDTHLPKRAKALPGPLLEELPRADVVIHAGDWVDTDTLDLLESRARRLIGVYGNNDGPDLRARLPEVAEAELGGLRFAVVHETGPTEGRERRCAEQYREHDVLVFGHSHIPWDSTADDGRLRLLNPGSPTDRRREPHCTYMTAEVADGELSQVKLHRLPPRT